MTGSRTSKLIAKLSAANRLDDEDIRAISTLPMRTQRVAAHHAVFRQGHRNEECCLLVEGFAFRSISTSDGERQIVSLHIPGEIPDLQSLHLHVMDHDLSALTECTLAFIPHAAIKAINVIRPNVSAALWRDTLVDAAIFREWIVNVGCRTGLVRMAHLLAELRHRLKTVGLATDDRFDLPITQIELGDCLGLSAVHTNRVLGELRNLGLVRTERTTFHLPDRVRLEQLGQFDPTYLHSHPIAVNR